MPLPNLSLAQFDQYAGANTPGVTLDAVTGISGTSLRYGFTTSSTQCRLLVPSATAGVPRGILVGQVSLATRRSLASPSGSNYGFAVGLSAFDVTSTGSCYSFVIRHTTTGGSLVRMTRHPSSGLGGIGTELAGAAFTETTDVVTIRLIWDLTTGTFEGFRGSALDYTDLSSVWTCHDPTPLPPGVGEGCFFSALGGVPSAHAVWLDNILVEVRT